MQGSLNWDVVRIFLAVAEAGSLSKASARLRISQPTVGRHIDELEAELGVVLLLRTARGAQLTDRGHELARVASPLAEGMGKFLRVATGAQDALEGRVRLAATEIVGVALLMPMLARLQLEYSKIDVDLVLDNRPADLLRGEADIAVRMFAPKEADLIGYRVGELPTALYASRSYVDRHGTPKNWNALLEHRLIGFDIRGPFANLYADVDPRLTSDRFCFRSDSLVAQLEAARQGVGIAGLQVEIASRYSSLQKLLPKTPMPSLPLWLVMHKDIRRGAHVRALFNGLKEQLTAYLAKL
jgi:DNA-binding transcriptional LysR family regulator